ncbi:hypothetical protein MBLNU230_g0378t1 [Neophaeotheca triangularis]
MSTNDDGASPSEQLLFACRRNNISLLEAALNDLSKTSTSKDRSEAIAHYLNTTTSPLGASPLHIAAEHGNYEALDYILDCEGVEIDHREPREGDTPLHKAVRYTNGVGKNGWEDGKAVVEILVDAGCDARLVNKARLKPLQLVDPRNEELKEVLRRAEFASGAGGDVVQEEDERRDGPGSESD